MQDIRTLEKHCVWSGIVYSDRNGKTTWRHFHGKQKEQVRLLKCIRTVCDLANCVDSLSKWENGSDGETGMLVPTLFH